MNYEAQLELLPCPHSAINDFLHPRFVFASDSEASGRYDAKKYTLEIISSCRKLQEKIAITFPCDPAPDDFFIFQQSAINYPETEIDSLVIVNDNVI